MSDELMFSEFPKIARLSRNCTITEKIDGTNASVFIGDDGTFLTGSRTRWITPQNDNFGFSKWAHEHKDDLMMLGAGHHFGEWWGSGIQRGYGLPKGEKRFSLFNAKRWEDNTSRPACCHIVPVIYSGLFTEGVVMQALRCLAQDGSQASPGFKPAEGVVIWHEAARVMFKKTILHDEVPKGFVEK